MQKTGSRHSTWMKTQPGLTGKEMGRRKKTEYCEKNLRCNQQSGKKSKATPTQNPHILKQGSYSASKNIRAVKEGKSRDQLRLRVCMRHCFTERVLTFGEDMKHAERSYQQGLLIFPKLKVIHCYACFIISRLILIKRHASGNKYSSFTMFTQFSCRGGVTP